jgi:histone deacetylase 1/2
MPENEYYDSDEGEAQGSGNNVTSRHQRDYNDTNDVQMSQEEEDQIAEALKQDEANDTEKEVTIEHIQEQDTEMDAADEAETNGNIQSIKAVEEDTVMEGRVK